MIQTSSHHTVTTQHRESRIIKVEVQRRRVLLNLGIVFMGQSLKLHFNGRN